MKKNLAKYSLLFAMAFALPGCNNPEEKPITNKDESTIIKNAKSTDEYLKKEDYKSIAYAYIYNIKEGLKSYESETKGTVKAKVAFFDYNIQYSSVTHKLGNTFYSKDNSTSTFMTVQNEFYMVDKEKILVSRDLKKYDVYTLEDYHKISYTPDQYTVMGYVFNNDSILKTELVSDKDDFVSIKYTLDNELATNLVKIDFKNNGDLSSYPTFKNIQFTLSMKRDFTPISYAIHAVYDASKPFIGTSEVTQSSECLFSKVNEQITIPNESFLASKLGAQPSQIVIGEEERAIKDGLLGALKNLDFANGIHVGGALTLDLFNNKIAMNLDANLAFDVSRLTKEKIYSALSFYAKLEGDETFNTLVSIIKTYAKDKLGSFEAILDDFKSVEVIYDGEGGLYLVPTNQHNAMPMVAKAKLTDLLDFILRQINIYNLVTGASNDYVSFNKKEGKDAGTYEVEIVLNEETISSIKAKIEELFANPDYSMIKTLLGYKDFDSIKLSVGVEGNKVKSFDASFNYLKQGNDVDPDMVKTLAKLHLGAEAKTFDHASKIASAKASYELYMGILDIKARIEEAIKNVYVSRGYLANLEKLYAEYQALSEQQKAFLSKNAGSELEAIKNKVANILLFMDSLSKFDLDHLNNISILALVKAYYANPISDDLLKNEIGDEKYDKINSLENYVDYSFVDSSITKINGDDETAWGLTEQEIKEVKLVFDIAQYATAISSQVWMKLLLAGKTLNADDFKAKITNLYNNLPAA